MKKFLSIFIMVLLVVMSTHVWAASDNGNVNKIIDEMKDFSIDVSENNKFVITEDQIACAQNYLSSYAESNAISDEQVKLVEDTLSSIKNDYSKVIAGVTKLSDLSAEDYNAIAAKIDACTKEFGVVISYNAEKSQVVVKTLAGVELAKYSSDFNTEGNILKKTGFDFDLYPAVCLSVAILCVSAACVAFVASDKKVSVR